MNIMRKSTHAYDWMFIKSISAAVLLSFKVQAQVAQANFNTLKMTELVTISGAATTLADTNCALQITFTYTNKSCLKCFADIVQAIERQIGKDSNVCYQCIAPMGNTVLERRFVMDALEKILPQETRYLFFDEQNDSSLFFNLKNAKSPNLYLINCYQQTVKYYSYDELFLNGSYTNVIAIYD